MREKQKRRRFSREFKLEAVRQLEAGQRLAEVARQLDVNRTVLQRWRAQFADDPEMSVSIATIGPAHHAPPRSASSWLTVMVRRLCMLDGPKSPNRPTTIGK